MIWSDSMRRPFRELLDVMDEIVARIAATVSGRIDQSELAAVRLKRPENMTAYDYTSSMFATETSALCETTSSDAKGRWVKPRRFRFEWWH